MPPSRRRDPRLTWAIGALVGLGSALALGLGMPGEPYFADEGAYLTQSFYVDLLGPAGRDDPEWLAYMAWDLPPLAKYIVGLALHVGGHPLPGPEAARAWYRDIDRRFDAGRPGMLTAARVPSVLLGALGCAAIYALGVQMHGRRAGVVAAALLIANPLYRLHAHRAMADVPAEAFVLATLAVALGSWRRILAGRSPPSIWPASAAGLIAGLAVLSKLNGGLGLIVLAAWAGLAAILPGFPARGKLAVAASLAGSGLFAWIAFVALNPNLTAHPTRPPPRSDPAVAMGLARRALPMGVIERARTVVDFRRDVSRGQQEMAGFGRFALTGPAAKVAAVAVQGFGRFGPLGPSHSDSAIRFDPRQDWGAAVWLPLVGLGFAWSLARGRSQLRAGGPPTAWAVALHAAVALTVVTAYVPLAWDRYFLPIQAGSALLVAGLVVAAGEWLARLVAGASGEVVGQRVASG